MFYNLSLIVDYGETHPKVPVNSNLNWNKRLGIQHLPPRAGEEGESPNGFAI
jgi:hypothetical protein